MKTAFSVITAMSAIAHPALATSSTSTWTSHEQVMNELDFVLNSNTYKDNGDGRKVMQSST